MPDLNDLQRPVTTDTEPNVLDTMRAHVIRAATWTWANTASKVAGLMTATTQAVSGGRSMRLYRRNDANTADEEVVSLPGVSIGGNASSATTAAACTGNASTASALQTARSFTINGSVKQFSGAADVSWSLTELGVPSNSGVGANGNWGISITGNAATATRVSAQAEGSTGVADLVYATMADNDQARIRVGGDATNQGWLEIATADDGTEPIYVRQYHGVFGNVVRTLTLLDFHGNTTIPGSLYVSGQIHGNGAVPAGVVVFHAGPSAPSGFLKCNGAAVSRTAYSALFAAISTYYGGGDGATTFNLPDLRGEFLRGWDEGRGADGGRGFGTWQNGDIQSHLHPMNADGRSVAKRAGYDALIDGISLRASVEDADYSGSQNTGAVGGAETRPRNVALLACIKF